MWISDQPFYKENTKWHCSCCGELTTVELNPEWVKVGKPLQWEKDQYSFEWFSRCSVCGMRHYDSSYECDTCGFSNDLFEFYYYFDEKTGKLKEIAAEPQGNCILPKESVKKRLDKKGIKIYPIFGPQYSNYDSGHDWKETHFCPYCKKEYSFINGS